MTHPKFTAYQSLDKSIEYYISKVNNLEDYIQYNIVTFPIRFLSGIYESNTNVIKFMSSNRLLLLDILKDLINHSNSTYDISPDGKLKIIKYQILEECMGILNDSDDNIVIEYTMYSGEYFPVLIITFEDSICNILKPFDFYIYLNDYK